MSRPVLKRARESTDPIGMGLARGVVLDARRRVGLCLHALASLALVPGFLLLEPGLALRHPGLVPVLCALAIIADRSDVPLSSGVRFDATIALTLLAVALVGPLAALAVYAAPALANAVGGRESLWRAGNLANLASAGWQGLAAAWLMQRTEGGPVPVALVGLLGAGAVLFYLGWAVGPAVYGPLWLGHPLRAMVESLRDMQAAATAMVVLGAATALAYPVAGVLSLALFALVAVLPQSALTYVARARPVARLDPVTASRRYAVAIAEHLGFDRAARRRVDAVVRLAFARGSSADPGEFLGHALADGSEISCAAGHVTEWWNGEGGPAGIHGRIIPLDSRIAAVAQTWAALTADGSPRIGHHEALSHLEAAAGVRLDPTVVRAARAVVAQERLTAAEPAPEPRLHHLRVPPRLRRALAASA